MDIGPRFVLVLIAVILAAVSAFIDAIPAATPRVRLFPLSFAVFAAAFLFPGPA